MSAPSNRDPVIRDDPGWLERSAPIVADLGFSIVTGVIPGDPAATDLVVALRDEPTLHHFDPEELLWWATSGERSQRRTLRRDTPLPIATTYEWGRIEIVDRLGMTNQWVSFGGTIRAADVGGDTTIVRFASPAPIQRWSGHSQGLDPLTAQIGAFFGRLMIPIDFEPGAEGRIVGADPLALYAAFVADAVARTSRSSSFVRAEQGLVDQVGREAHRLRLDAPDAWAAGEALLGSLEPGG